MTIIFPQIMFYVKFMGKYFGSERLITHKCWGPRYQGRVGIPLTSETPPHFCACPMAGPGFPTLSIMDFLCMFRCEVIVRFVDSDGIVDLLILVELLTITV